jgi:amino acid adenylation domain-containing protein
VRTPQADAVISASRSLSYSELNGRANRLARYLRSHGVGPGVMVAVCLERTWEMTVALLAVLKAGGAYMPLDPDYPAERLAFMVGDAQAQLLLTQETLLTRIPSQAVATFCLDRDWEETGGESEADLPDGAEPDDLAYVIYTSGSTGVPKGVQIAHRGICNNLRWRQEAFPLSAHDRLLQTYSFSFDPSVWAFFWPLTSGAAVVLPHPGDSGDPVGLVQTIQKHQISVLGFSPSMLGVLLGHPGFGRCGSLRHVFSGGEALAPGLRDRFFAVLPSTALHNVYGPTEATIDTTWWDCSPSEGGTVVPIGRPLPQMQVYLLGEDGQPVGAGDSGELHVAGVGLARGYLHRPELTAERFVPNPFCRDAEERVLYPTLYRTGDLCRQRDDGAIEYLGRLDQQVKLRGFRIELGEIESLLVRQSGVREATASVLEERVGDPRLIAYIVPDADAPPKRAALREALQAALPAHMVPGAFVFLDTLPLSPTGKRDRSALPVPSAEDWERDHTGTAPQTPLQWQLVQIWEDLLGISPVGINEDFFALGGHSLLAAQLVDQIALGCGREIPLAALYAGATVERLAAIIQNQEETFTPSPVSRIKPEGDQPPLFFLYGFLPMGGFYSFQLARHLPANQPFFVLHPAILSGSSRPATIEGMAGYYLKTIREQQPQGPYRLGGYCGAGLVAYEVARQLTAEGETVEILALIEVAPISARPRAFAQRLVRTLARPATRQAWTMRAERMLLPVVAAWQDLKRFLRPSPSGTISPLEATQERLLLHSDRAAARYVPKPYSGPVTFFCATDDPERFREDPVTLWQDIISEVRVQPVPGDHMTCLTEHVGALGEGLRTQLAALSMPASQPD